MPVKILFSLFICALFTSLVARAEPFSASIVAWSHNGDLLAVGLTNNDEHLIHIHDLDLGTVQHFTITGRPVGLEWSPSDEYLAIRHDNNRAGYDIYVISVTSGQQILIDSTAGALCDPQVYWANRGDLIAAPKISTIDVWNSTNANRIVSLEASNLPYGLCVIGIGWNKSDTTIYAGFELGQIASWDISTGVGELLIQHSAYLVAFALHPENRLIAVSDVQGVITIYDVVEKAVIQTYAITAAEDSSRLSFLQWTNNGDTLVGITSSGIVFQWDIQENVTLPVFVTRGAGDQLMTGADLSPFSGRLAIAWAYFPYVSGLNRTSSFDGNIQNIAEGTADIIVPDASLKRLNRIIEACTQLSPQRTQLRALDVTTDLPAYIARVEALPADAIPPACRADLLAVAGALLAGE